MTYEIDKLKARAYDIIAALEQLQRDLQSINAEIARKEQEHAKDAKEHREGE